MATETGMNWGMFERLLCSMIASFFINIVITNHDLLSVFYVLRYVRVISVSRHILEKTLRCHIKGVM